MTDSLADRISKIEATQHFTLGLITALIKVLPERSAFFEHARQDLEAHHAYLCGTSFDDVKVQAFQELLLEVVEKSRE